MIFNSAINVDVVPGVCFTAPNDGMSSTGTVQIIKLDKTSSQVLRNSGNFGKLLFGSRCQSQWGVCSSNRSRGTSSSIYLPHQMNHYSDVIMSAMTSHITDVLIVQSRVCSGADQGKHQRSASLAFVRGIHRWPVNSPHKGPVTQKIFSFDDVILRWHSRTTTCLWIVLNKYHYEIYGRALEVHFSTWYIIIYVYIGCK